MKSLQLISTTPVSRRKGHNYSGIACDSANIYLSLSDKAQVHMLNRSFEAVKRFKTRRIYSALYYDANISMFRALSLDLPGHVFTLDSKLQEVDCMNVKWRNFSTPLILGISSNDKGEIVLCGDFGVARVDALDGTLLSVHNKDTCIAISLSNSVELRVLDSASGHILHCIPTTNLDTLRFSLSDRHLVSDVCSLSENEKELTVFLLSDRSGDYSYISELLLS